MKILQVNCVYRKGSTGKIVYDIHTGLIERGIESVVCYGRGKNVNELNVYKVCNEVYSYLNNIISRFTGLMYGGCIFSTKKLIAIIKKEQPDIVHLHCINGYFVNIYRLISWLKNNKVPTILTLHAEFMHTANCGYALECEKWRTGCGKCPRLKQETKSFFVDGTSISWKRMKSAFEGFNDNLIVASVSAWLMERAKQSPILSDKRHCVVYNGLDTNIFHVYSTVKLRKELGIEDNEKIIFHATPKLSLDPMHIKGGYYVVELAKAFIKERVKVVVAGDYDKNYEYPSNMIMLGRIADQVKLAQLYSLADVTVLTSKKETFSMVTAESLCCGTLVVGFKAGAPERIAIKEYSRFVEQEDIEALVEAVRESIFTIVDKYEIEEDALKKYAMNIMYDEYIRHYKEVCKKKERGR